MWSGGAAPDGGVPDAGAGGADAGSSGGGGAADAGGGGTGGGGTASACDGVVPTSNPPGRAATVPHASGDACWYFTSDSAGTVAAEAHNGSGADPRWQLWSGSGAAQGGFNAGFDLFGQSSGFAGTARQGGSTSYVRWDASGAPRVSRTLGGQGCVGEAFGARTGGVLTLGGCAGGGLVATLFDDRGNQGASAQVGPAPGDAIGLVDERGQVLVVLWPGSRVGLSEKAAARWYDPSLAPTTGWFGLPGAGDRPVLAALVGGGAAMRVAAGDWVAVIASGAAGFTPPPDWLASHRLNDLAIVRGGRAYALIARHGAASPRTDLDLYTPAGEKCGTGTFNAEGLSVGMDGTVIGTGGEGGCNVTWWPGVLR